jgi:hypothetical protein
MLLLTKCIEMWGPWQLSPNKYYQRCDFVNRNGMCQLDETKDCPDSWQDITSHVSMKMYIKRLSKYHHPWSSLNPMRKQALKLRGVPSPVLRNLSS